MKTKPKGVGRLTKTEVGVLNRVNKTTKGRRLAKQLSGGDTPSIIGDSCSSPKVRKMGKRFSAYKRKPVFEKGSPRWNWCMRFRELVKGRAPEEVAKTLGISGDLARKYIGGTRAPDIDEMPAVATALGVSDWTEFLRPRNS